MDHGDVVWADSGGVFSAFDQSNDVKIAEWGIVCVEFEFPYFAQHFASEGIQFVINYRYILFVEVIRDGLAFSEDFVVEGYRLVRWTMNALPRDASDYIGEFGRVCLEIC